jgi:hypothetical protein
MIKTYSRPPNGPYEEIHAVDHLTVEAANVSFYSDYDGTTATPICNGAATTFNFTINFCGTNATVAAAVLHMLHLTGRRIVGAFLGGKYFSSRAAPSNPTASSTSTPAMFTANAATLNVASMSSLILLAGGLLAWVVL